MFIKLPLLRQLTLYHIISIWIQILLSNIDLLF